jgi:predicted phosphodiesterase
MAKTKAPKKGKSGRPGRYNQYRSEVLELLNMKKTPKEISESIAEVPYNTIYNWCVVARQEMEDFIIKGDADNAEMIEHAGFLSKSRQKMMDKNRVREKILRENFRKNNAVEEYAKELIKVFSENKLTEKTMHHKDGSNSAAAIIHLSDLHFNELIDIPSNKFNFDIASARLKLLVRRVKAYLKPYNVKNVLVAMTGDMLNSDRRLDEMLCQATNRTNATFLAVDILQQFICDLNKSYNVKVAYVSGNESRAKDEIGWSDESLSDNYDTMIFDILKRLFNGSEGVSFFTGDVAELVVKVGPLHILMLHGNGAMSKDVERSVEQIKGRYAERKQIIDYVIFGHLHSARIGDTFARSSSLAGSNSYNERSLNLYGRASQNLYVIHHDGLRDGMRIDLQIINSEDKYEIDTTLAAYNTKSESKNRTRRTVLEVTI